MNAQLVRQQKYCHQCERMQSLDNFCWSRGCLTSPCRECRRKQERRWRANHPSLKGLRGAGVGAYSGRDPDTPTDALPGTPEKIAVLEQRAARGVGLWHELDRPLEFDPPPLDDEETFDDELD